MTKAKEIRDMADEQIRLVWKDASETLFRLRIQAQTEKLAAPTEIRKHRRTIARCQTILAQRGVLAPAAEPEAEAVDASPRHEKHAKKHHASGRAKLRSVTKGRVGTRREFKKRTQSGN
jgi:large subunit ribosomal protein L29